MRSAWMLPKRKAVAAANGPLLHAADLDWIYMSRESLIKTCASVCVGGGDVPRPWIWFACNVMSCEPSPHSRVVQVPILDANEEPAVSTIMVADRAG